MTPDKDGAQSKRNAGTGEHRTLALYPLSYRLAPDGTRTRDLFVQNEVTAFYAAHKTFLNRGISGHGDQVVTLIFKRNEVSMPFAADMVGISAICAEGQ